MPPAGALAGWEWCPTAGPSWPCWPSIGRPERDYYGWMCPNCGGFRAELNPDTLELTILEEYRGEKGL